IERNEIRDNGQQPGCSGGVGGGGIAALPARDDSPILQDNVVTGNGWGTAGLGGGGITVYGSSSSFTVVARNRISANSAGTQGGGLMARGTPALVVDNLVYGNSALTGGGIFAMPPSSPLVTIVLENNTVADNTGSDGAALFLDGPGNTAVDNNILV